MKYSDVKMVEIDLTSTCNLRCRLCAHHYKEAQHIIKPYCRPLAEWKQQIDKYENLEELIFAGILSEPTLYPNFIELVDYCATKQFSISIYTNGNTHDCDWWNEFGKHLRKQDKVVFTVCGSTQELHEKYRVGSNLQQILDHAASFRNSNKNDYVQHIKFKYNEDDLNTNMMPILKQFSHYDTIETLPYNERFDVIQEPTDIRLCDRKSNLYKKIAKHALLDFMTNRDQCHIDCISQKYNFISIDNFGNEFPCFLWRLYCEDQFNILDFSNIVEYKYSFCYECEKKTQQMLKLIGIEPVA